MIISNKLVAMNLWKLLTLAFLLIVCSDTSRAQGKDTVKCWSNYVKLQWRDFRGNVPKAKPHATQRAASESYP